MKKLYFLLAIILISSTKNLISQGFTIYDQEALSRGLRAAQLSEFIFEGTVISQDYYESPTKNILYTVNVIEIYKIFKGQDELNCGTVSLIHEGGVDLNSQYKQRKDYSPHGESFAKGTTGIFFAVRNDDVYKGVSPTLKASNKNILLRNVFPMYGMGITYEKKIIDLYSIDEINGAASGFLGIKFESLSDMYNLINLAYGIDLTKVAYCNNTLQLPLDENGKMVLRPDTEPVNNPIQQNPVTVKNDYAKYLAKMIEILPTVKKKSQRFNGSITLSFENEEITTTGNNKFLEFDVYFNATNPGTYLHNIPVRIQYNTSTFGDSIFGRGNLSITSGSIFSGYSYSDPMTVSQDVGTNKFVALITTILSTTTNRVSVPTSPTKLIHLKMKIQNCGNFSGIYFTDNIQMNNAALHTLTSGDQNANLYQYDNVATLGSLNDQMCSPRIDNITTYARAGVKDVLQIDGAYFGNQRGNGQVLLKSAEDGGGSYIRLNDYIDYNTWTNNQIKIYVTSLSDTFQTLFSKEASSAGTGKIWVRTNTGDSIQSSQELYVPFSILNVSAQYGTSNYNKYRSHLVNANGAAQGSYTFRCDTSISNYPLRKAIVEKAIHEWNCRTGVDWVLGPDITSQVAASDGISVIFFDPSLHGIPIARTYQRNFQDCQTPNGRQVFPTEIDIRLSIDFTNETSQPTWFYDTLGLGKPSNKIDFFGVLIHELGHAHSLGHNNDINDIMYFKTEKDSLPPNRRLYNSSRWVTSVDAGNYVMDISQNASWQSCTYLTAVRNYPSGCTLIGSTNDKNNLIQHFKIYPNPSSTGLLNVEYDLQKFSNVELKIFDISGKEIWFEDMISGSIGNNYLTINYGSLSKGLYMLQLSTPDAKTTQRLIVN